jgi:hypothetical protein
VVEPILVALGVTELFSPDPVEAVPDDRASSCLAVMPRYLLARDPSVMLAAACAALFGSASSSTFRGVRVVTDRVPKLGVVAPRRILSEAGVARPEAEYDEVRERCEATDAGRDVGAGVAVGGASFSASAKIPQLGSHSKYLTLGWSASFFRKHGAVSHPSTEPSFLPLPLKPPSSSTPAQMPSRMWVGPK